MSPGFSLDQVNSVRVDSGLTIQTNIYIHSKDQRLQHTIDVSVSSLGGIKKVHDLRIQGHDPFNLLSSSFRKLVKMLVLNKILYLILREPTLYVGAVNVIPFTLNILC